MAPPADADASPAPTSHDRAPSASGEREKKEGDGGAPGASGPPAAEMDCNGGGGDGDEALPSSASVSDRVNSSSECTTAPSSHSADGDAITDTATAPDAAEASPLLSADDGARLDSEKDKARLAWTWTPTVGNSRPNERGGVSTGSEAASLSAAVPVNSSDHGSGTTAVTEQRRENGGGAGAGIETATVASRKTTWDPCIPSPSPVALATSISVDESNTSDSTEISSGVVGCLPDLAAVPGDGDDGAPKESFPAVLDAENDTAPKNTTVGAEKPAVAAAVDPWATAGEEDRTGGKMTGTRSSYPVAIALSATAPASTGQGLSSSLSRGAGRKVSRGGGGGGRVGAETGFRVRGSGGSGPLGLSATVTLSSSTSTSSALRGSRPIFARTASLLSGERKTGLAALEEKVRGGRGGRERGGEGRGFLPCVVVRFTFSFFVSGKGSSCNIR